jgi:hypothetical protein
MREKIAKPIGNGKAFWLHAVCNYACVSAGAGFFFITRFAESK